MEQHFLNNNNRRSSTTTMTTNSQIPKDSYEYELMKLMERERQVMAAQVIDSYRFLRIIDLSFLAT